MVARIHRSYSLKPLKTFKRNIGEFLHSIDSNTSRRSSDKFNVPPVTSNVVINIHVFRSTFRRNQSKILLGSFIRSHQKEDVAFLCRIAETLTTSIACLITALYSISVDRDYYSVHAAPDLLRKYIPISLAVFTFTFVMSNIDMMKVIQETSSAVRLVYGSRRILGQRLKLSTRKITQLRNRYLIVS